MSKTIFVEFLMIASGCVGLITSSPADSGNTHRLSRTTASSPARLVQASQAGAALDSDLMKGGGTDDTVVLQRLLDRGATGKGLHLIVDGPALVSGLTVYGNTTIECTAGGGFYLKNGSSQAVIRNAHRSRNAVVDEHIGIRGCFINGNRNGQSDTLGPENSPFRYVQEADGTFRTGVQFFGVNYLTIENVTLWNVRGFHSWIANAKFISIRNVIVDTAIPPFPEQAITSLSKQVRWHRQFRANDDGLHFTGPIQYLTIADAKVRTLDDGISMCANDWGVGPDDITVHNEMGPFVGQGPITDVTISNVTFMDSFRGIRMMSGDQRMDRVSIQNVTGTNRMRFVVISHMVNHSRGNFGSITLGNVNVDPSPHLPWTARAMDAVFAPTFTDTDLTKEEKNTSPAEKSEEYLNDLELTFLALNAHIESLHLNHVATRAIDSRPLIRVGPDAEIGTLNGNFSIQDPAARAVPITLRGHIQRMKLSLDWAGSTSVKYEGGTIDRLDEVRKQ